MATFSFAQRLGYVQSQESNGPISGAYVLSDQGYSCYSDSLGVFQLGSMQLGNRLTIVAAGFQTLYTYYFFVNFIVQFKLKSL